MLAEERGDEHPLVFGGGPVLTANPEPYAAFFDVVLLGGRACLRVCAARWCRQGAAAALRARVGGIGTWQQQRQERMRQRWAWRQALQQG